MSCSESFETGAESANSNSVTSERRCKHGMRAVLYISWSRSNPGRRFFRCPVWKDDDCGFFSWYDDVIPPRQKEIISHLVETKKLLESKVELMQKKESAMEDVIKHLEAQVMKHKMFQSSHQLEQRANQAFVSFHLRQLKFFFAL
ncbi:hypothetical protein MLD38_018222 [Melastoma candidum]|uniref:Uncharacterized protein n=1 Tax=Melastoma candidum TaxID=119954 RepID=A0ACB9QT68_9MYRT|nr:hypothetical protein MLD38_018222 [Melastoma candidum]